MSTEVTDALGRHAIETIAAAARGMYPHADVPVDVYEQVAAKVAEVAAEDAEQARMIAAGVEEFDGGAAPFVELDDADRLALLRSQSGSPFFELVRGTAVVEVYSSPITWRVLGYEGPCFEQGGYVDRGFDDLDWLPDSGEGS